MKTNFKIILLLLFANLYYGQKKPLDHSAYDQWETITNRQISNNGKWTSYAVTPQEGDENLYIQTTDNRKKISIPRATSLQFSNDSRFAIALIKPFYKDTKAVKDKKLKKEKLAKDTLAIVNLETNKISKIANVKSFKMSEKGNIAIAYLLENLKEKDTETDSKDKENKDVTNTKPLELIVKYLSLDRELKFKNVVNYSFNKNGSELAFITKIPTPKEEKSKDKTEEDKKDSFYENNEEKTAKNDKTKPKKYELQSVNWVNLANGKISKLIEYEGNFNHLAFDETGNQLAFIGTNSAKNDLIKDYKLYYFNKNNTKNKVLETQHKSFRNNWRITENTIANFSKNGKNLFFGIAPKPIIKDTALIANDHAVVDIWGYKDLELQTIQLKNLAKEQKKTYTTVLNTETNQIINLADLETDSIKLIDNGDANYVLANTTNNTEIEAQWTARTIRSYYLIDVKTGQKQTIINNLNGNVYPSPKGNFIVYFNRENGNWYNYNVAKKTTDLLNKNIKTSFVDEEFDMPDLPRSYGLSSFTDQDQSVIIEDRYDLWEFDLNGKNKPRNITNNYGRDRKIKFETYQFDPEIESLNRTKPIYLSAFDDVTKKSGIYRLTFASNKNPERITMQDAFGFRSVLKAKDTENYILTKESNLKSPNLFATTDFKEKTQLSDTNTQQKNYYWNTNELVTWTTPKGNKANGVLYKPENFDPNKKYPMLVYFYEKLSDNLNKYQAPAPTPSRLMISYFASNGYLVFTPDIKYTEGKPGASAEEYINSGVEELKKNKWVNAEKIGIQGQSWGGYQVAHLITRTNMYAAAWSGAPVVNMTSAYGGIRWTSGMNRQFQYEKTQSRIGKTLWEAHDLYIENSPLFYLDKVETPVAIMHNDEDGAVPWYQGIEMFTALKRLGKPSWLLNYNNEDHNLVKRQNRKDISIRQEQFFNHYLKDEKAPLWMTKGIPATQKGIDWGFDLTDEQP